MTHRRFAYKTVIFECPWCDHITEERVCEKTTSVCQRCEYPCEVYEDGRVEASALMVAVGDVQRDMGRALMCRRPSIRTIHTK